LGRGGDVPSAVDEDLGRAGAGDAAGADEGVRNGDLVVVVDEEALRWNRSLYKGKAD